MSSAGAGEQMEQSGQRFADSLFGRFLFYSAYRDSEIRKIGCGRKIEKEAVVEAGKMLFFGRT